MSSPPLPYRPLEVKANGVWDPLRKTFYPWISASPSGSGTAAAAKPGIHYFLHFVEIAAENRGDKGIAANAVTVSVGGTNFYVVCVAATTTAASGVSSANNVVAVVDVLTDVKTEIGYTVNCSYGACDILYAEIPADEGEQP